MSKSSKFAGSRRAGNTVGNVPAASRKQFQPTGRGSGSPKVAISQGSTAEGCSSHNNISMFVRGARSRGPYGGPSFRSLGNYTASGPKAVKSPSGK